MTEIFDSLFAFKLSPQLIFFLWRLNYLSILYCNSKNTFPMIIENPKRKCCFIIPRVHFVCKIVSPCSFTSKNIYFVRVTFNVIIQKYFDNVDLAISNGITLILIYELILRRWEPTFISYNMIWDSDIATIGIIKVSGN